MDGCEDIAVHVLLEGESIITAEAGANYVTGAASREDYIMREGEKRMRVERRMAPLRCDPHPLVENSIILGDWASQSGCSEGYMEQLLSHVLPRLAGVLIVIISYIYIYSPLHYNFYNYK